PEARRILDPVSDPLLRELGREVPEVRAALRLVLVALHLVAADAREPLPRLAAEVELVGARHRPVVRVAEEARRLDVARRELRPVPVLALLPLELAARLPVLALRLAVRSV